MLTEEELREVDIRQWYELQREFVGADLFLGNGFSIKLAAQFNYVSLFEKFLADCGAAAKALFQGLSSSNFEDIQRILLDAKRVAELLGSPLAGIDGYVNALREGLIKAIHESHPRAAEIDKEKLRELSKQFDLFGDVFTTNYDLFLYHIIMICKDRYERDKAGRPYNDYFWNRLNGFLRFMTFQHYPQYKHVYYLHGALFIFPEEEPGQRELKLCRGGDEWELLDEIDTLIRSGRLPLFVTEGSSAQKVRTIGQSLYLRFALEKFAKAREVMVIYGCAFGDTDRHIVGVLDTRRRLAVSIHVDDKNREALQAEVKAAQGKLARHSVVMFDSRGLF